MDSYNYFSVLINIFIFLFIIDPLSVICAEYQFTNKSSSERSYIVKMFSTVEESKFPAKLKLSFVLSTLKGPLIYSIDHNGNALDINIDVLLSFGNVLNVQYRGKDRAFDIKQLCNCRRECLYEKLDLLVEVGDKLNIQCNQGTKKTIVYGDKLNKNSNFDKFSKTNQAYLWLWNTPVGILYSGQNQLVGCLLNATYRDEKIEFGSFIGPNFKKGCPRSCKKGADTIIVKAKCIETYSNSEYECSCYKPEFNRSISLSTTTGSPEAINPIPGSKSSASGTGLCLPCGCTLWKVLFVIFLIICIIELIIIIIIIIYFKRRRRHRPVEGRDNVPLNELNVDLEATNRPGAPTYETAPLLVGNRDIDVNNSSDNVRYQDDMSYETIPMDIIGSTDQNITPDPEIDAVALEYAKSKFKISESTDPNKTLAKITKISDPELDLDDPPEDSEQIEAVAESKAFPSESITLTNEAVTELIASPSESITLTSIPKPHNYDFEVHFSPNFPNTKLPVFTDYFKRPFDLDDVKQSVTKHLGIDKENIYLMNSNKTVLNEDNFYPELEAELDIFYLELKEFKRLEEPVILHEGRYSMVQEYKPDNSNKTMAMKYYKYVLSQDKSKGKKIHHVLTEVEFLLKCQGHRNIVIFDSLTRIRNDSLIISMEMMEGSTLQKYIDEHKKSKGVKLNEHDIKMYLKQILSGLSHIHKNRIIHLNINCDNLLLSKDYRTVKITDFSLSKSIANGVDFVKLESEPESKYKPPEVIAEICEFKTDIWCLGCSLEEMRIEQDNGDDAIARIIAMCKADDLDKRPTTLELQNNDLLK